jgi:hypothetical protein
MMMIDDFLSVVVAIDLRCARRSSRERWVSVRHRLISLAAHDLDRSATSISRRFDLHLGRHSSFYF